MEGFKIYDSRNAIQYISKRPGEEKFGEKIKFVEDFFQLKEHKANFVLFGIPEDIGVRANSGKAGTANAWTTCLKYLLNIQANKYTNPENMILLGEVDCREGMEKAAGIEKEDPNYTAKLSEIVADIDKVVSEVIAQIISAGKIPVIIGGGHNNAYGNIKGASVALGKKINVLNIDAHTDLRLTDHRHSGNGFSFALKNSFLENYAVFGLHENYTPEYIFEEMQNSENLHYRLLENSGHEHSRKFETSLEFVKDKVFGLEVDCDSMANFPSSAISPSGFALDEVRQFVSITAKEKNCIYLHICEAVDNGNYPTGKAISYLISDFIKNRNK